MGYTELRLKVRHFIKKYKKILITIFFIWLIIFMVNYYLKNRTVVERPSTTYTPHISVMDSGSTTPKNMQEPIENMIKEYVETCNDGNYQKAYNMLSEDCKKYQFENKIENFMEHVLTKMPIPKKYSIQDYSNMQLNSKNLYIYEIKYIDDILATGLTNSQYMYTSEKMMFLRDDDGTIQMSVGGYINHSNIKSISENEYLKIDIIDKIVKYTTETYEIKFTNRSDYTIVITDGNEVEEIALQLPKETRKPDDLEVILLGPGESITRDLTFSKFADDGDTSQSIIFQNVRVLEHYSIDDDEKIKEEVNNAIAKFSMEVNIME